MGEIWTARRGGSSPTARRCQSTSTFALVLASTSAALGAPKPGETLERRLHEKLDQGASQEALKILDEWKVADGENDPQYWVAGGNVWFALGSKNPVAITALPAGKYDITAGQGASFDIRDPETGQPVGQIAAGSPRIDEEKVRKAIQFLDRGIALAPNRLDIYVGRAHLYRAIGDKQGELKALESMAKDPQPRAGGFETGPGTALDRPLADYQVQTLNSYAREHFQEETEAGDRTGVEVARLLVRLFPKKAHGYNLLATAASFRKDWKEAVKWTDRALAVAPGDSLVLANKAMGLEKLGDARGARKCYEKIIELDNDPQMVREAKAALKRKK